MISAPVAWRGVAESSPQPKASYPMRLSLHKPLTLRGANPFVTSGVTIEDGRREDRKAAGEGGYLREHPANILLQLSYDNRALNQVLGHTSPECIADSNFDILLGKFLRNKYRLERAVLECLERAELERDESCLVHSLVQVTRCGALARPGCPSE